MTRASEANELARRAVRRATAAQMEWENRPRPWWDVEGHIAERVRLGLPPLDQPDD